MIRQKSIGVCILLTFITCGIYGFVWMYQMAEDVNTVTRRPNATSGGMVRCLAL